MANVRISQLPAVTSVTSTDVFPVVATATTSKLSIKNLANSLTQVTSSLSSSLAVSSSYALSSSLAVSSSYALSSSLAVSASYAPGASPISVIGTTIYSNDPSAGGNFSTNQILLGSNAGSGSSSANDLNSFGFYAGFNAINASYSNFIGRQSGYDAQNANNSNFIGQAAGFAAISANNSNFIGEYAGFDATSANHSNFLGEFAGSGSTNANNSNFIGQKAGVNALNASYSSYIGFAAGRAVLNGPGSNNIVIGTNITLPDSTVDSINLGGVIFATGSYSDTTSAVFAGAMTDARVGINKVSPEYTLDVSGSGNYANGLTVTGSIIGTDYIQGNSVVGTNWVSIKFGGTQVPAFGTILRGDVYLSTASTLGYTFYYNDTNIGHAVPNAAGNIPAGAIKLVRQQADTLIGGPFGAGEGKIPIYTIISNNFSLEDGSTNYTYSQQNGRDHVLTVSGSILSKNAVSLGTSLTDSHIISGSVGIVGGPLTVTGSFIVTGSFRVPAQEDLNPATGSMYVKPATNELWIYTGNSVTGWVTASLGI